MKLAEFRKWQHRTEPFNLAGRCVRGTCASAYGDSQGPTFLLATATMNNSHPSIKLVWRSAVARASDIDVEGFIGRLHESIIIGVKLQYQ